jgi:hypothetical protein
MTPSPTKQERVDAAYAEHSRSVLAALNEMPGVCTNEQLAVYHESCDAADRALRDTLAEIERGE